MGGLRGHSAGLEGQAGRKQESGDTPFPPHLCALPSGRFSGHGQRQCPMGKALHLPCGRILPARTPGRGRISGLSLPQSLTEALRDHSELSPFLGPFSALSAPNEAQAHLGKKNKTNSLWCWPRPASSLYLTNPLQYVPTPSSPSYHRSHTPALSMRKQKCTELRK